MSSDEEDFNDIYGEDSSKDISTTTENKKEQAEPTTAAVTSSTETTDKQDDSKKDTEEPTSKDETKVEEKSDDSKEKTAEESDTKKDESKEDKESANKPTSTTSQLDQLAALQALSSNISQMAQQSTKPDTSVKSPSLETSSNSVSNMAPNNPPWAQPQPHVPAYPNQSPPMPYGQASPYPPTMPMQQQQPPQASPYSSVPLPSQAQAYGGQTGGAQTGGPRADLSKESCKLFIGGLNWETTEEKLKDYFSKYGNVVDLKIMKDANSGRSRGFGFLSFEHPSSVDEVVKSQHILDGKVIDPKRAIPREEQDKTGKIFVGGIGPDVRPKEFEEFFAQWGTIIDAQLMLDKDTGRSRGFGFITYDSGEAVDRVCQNKYIQFKDKQIEIKRAAPRHNQRNNSYGNGGRGGSRSYNNNPMSQPPQQQMYQNQMMAAAAGMNPMYDPQAMNDYYQQMQAYYQQVQQQTGMDYSQMYQQAGQPGQPTMPMPMPMPMGGAPPYGGVPPTGAPSGDNSSESATPNADDQDGGNQGNFRGYRGRTQHNRRGNNNGYHPYNRS
ncbi:uncharacterized protein NDAI_0A06170 [Naumovozyma dairenensis CBS 421]|uniref:RRM domain-containing protein n=1 Tax=Naumovozyma dairenensis (strain ATCC 10597 / BCRC 20456 / CBS 421 / NBRC 0211 / NRRL Y-12639) TaxID=1071378 RepID=G0W4N4_NAUDC|nr:hypothetical protein NDAI_0A06170 [Naumovozyma dairenensis CBS 421]CCD22772.1 hypothetical protein NDAI_0A06170 [Naumovozyma dairenensis CBS 421]